MLCQSSHGRIRHMLLSNSWVFGCFWKSLRSSCVLENQIQQWWNTGQSRDIKDESSPNQTTVNSQVGTARSNIVSPAGSFDTTSLRVCPTNRRNISMDGLIHCAVLDKKCQGMETLHTTTGQQDTRTNQRSRLEFLSRWVESSGCTFTWMQRRAIGAKPNVVEWARVSKVVERSLAQVASNENIVG